MARMVVDHPDATLKVVIEDGGTLLSVGPLLALSEVEFVSELLDTVSAAAAAGTPGSEGEQEPAASLPQCVQQLQACRHWLHAHKDYRNSLLWPANGRLHAARSLLSAAAFLGHTQTLQLLVKACPDAASQPYPNRHWGMPLLVAARGGYAETVRLLLAAVPDVQNVARVQDGQGRVPLHEAAERGHEAAVQLLVSASADAAWIGDGKGQLPIHLAAEKGHAAIVAHLLAAAPGAAAATTVIGQTPFHYAARGGRPAVLRQLLAAAPLAACLPDSRQLLPIHWAAYSGSAEAVRLLLAACPGTAGAADAGGGTPAHYASCREDAEALKLLVAASPATASQPNRAGLTPLARALQMGIGNQAAIRFLLVAAPASAVARDNRGHNALQVALDLGMHTAPAFDEAMRCLVAASAGADPLATLLAAGPAAAHLLAEAVVPRLPMAPADWARLPSPCPGLGRALPASLAHSDEQARQVAARLPAADRERIQLAALCLARAQKEEGVDLPGPAVRRILGAVAAGGNP